MPADTAVDPRTWLREQLADGPRHAGEVQAEAEAAGISAKRLRAAREELCAPPTREGRGPWTWTLRDQEPVEGAAPPQAVESTPHGPPSDDPHAVASRAQEWARERAALGDMTLAQLKAARWLIGKLADGPLHEFAVAELAATEDPIPLDDLRAVAQRLVVREGGTRTAPQTATWRLRPNLPPPPMTLVATHALKAAVDRGWAPNPRAAAWLASAGPEWQSALAEREWLRTMAERHLKRVRAVAEAEAERDLFAEQSAAMLAEHAHELEAIGPVGAAISLQVTERERARREDERLEREARQARQALTDLVARQEREEAALVRLKGRQVRGLDLPRGWQPGDPILAAATARSTRRSTASLSPAPAAIRRRSSSSRARRPKARPTAKRSGASSATSPAASGSCCARPTRCQKRLPNHQSLDKGAAQGAVPPGRCDTLAVRRTSRAASTSRRR